MIGYDAIMQGRALLPPPSRTRGGRRPGAGRPPSYREPLRRKTVVLPDSYIDQLTALGAGNLSEGIRLLVETAYTHRGTLWYQLPPSFAPPTINPAPPRSAPAAHKTPHETERKEGR